MAEQKRPTLEGLLEKAFRTMLADVELGLPGRVVSYDAAAQKATVEPVATKRYDDGTEEKMPAVANVPVQFPGGAGFAITWPLEPGDPVWLSFSGRPFDAWKATGDKDAAEPSRRRFSLADCVAFPQGPRAFGSALESAEDAAMVLGEDDPDGLKIRIAGGKISIGNGNIELLNSLHKLVHQLKIATVPTSAGPQKLDPATAVVLDDIKDELDELKKDEI